MNIIFSTIIMCCLSHILSAQQQSFSSSSALSSGASYYFSKSRPQQPDSIPVKRLLDRAPSVRIGFKIGLNLARMNFNKGFPPPASPVETSGRAGFLIGFQLDVPFHQRLSIQQEYLFSHMPGEHKNSGIAYSLNYLSLPVLLKYKLTSKIAIKTGLQFDLMIQAKEFRNGHAADITNDTEERSIGATAGIEYQLKKQVNLEVRYMHGLNHIGIGQRSFPTEYKYELLQFAAGISF